MKWVITDIDDLKGTNDRHVSSIEVFRELLSMSRNDPSKTFALYGNNNLRLRMKDGVVTEHRPSWKDYHAINTRQDAIDAYHWATIIELEVGDVDYDVIHRLSVVMSGEFNEGYIQRWFEQTGLALDREQKQKDELRWLSSKFDARRCPFYDSKLKE